MRAGAVAGHVDIHRDEKVLKQDDWRVQRAAGPGRPLAPDEAALLAYYRGLEARIDKRVKAAVPSCGGSGGSVPPPPPSGWVVIDAPASTDTVCNELGLSGEAFISPTDWHCCGGSAVEMTAVTVTWRNETSGAAGTASQSVKTSPFLGLYGHTWSATVPLVPGTNRIAVTATAATRHHN